MFGRVEYSPPEYETYEPAENQARLEYYSDRKFRRKYNKDGGGESYWTASPQVGTITNFCYVTGLGEPWRDWAGTPPNDNVVRGLLGCVPAFCVK